jgi:hypothetical protein
VAPPSRDPPARDDDSDASLSRFGAPGEGSGTSLPLPPAPSSSPSAVAAAVDEATPSFDPGLSRVVAALLRFVGSKDRDKGRAFIRGVVMHKLYGPKKPKKMDADLVDELTHLAALRALEARTPPWTEWGIPGWVARVTKRAIADYFSSREDDDEYLDREADAVEWSDRHAPATDWGAREHLIAKYIEGLIGDDAGKKHTFRLMMEKEVVGRSVEELAAENGTTPSGLSNRFHKLRKELYPHVSIMDEEKPRRTFILALLFFFGLGALVAIAIALWHLLAPPQLLPEPLPPLPSATAAPAPSLDIAQPPEPEQEQDVDAGEPGPLRKR